MALPTTPFDPAKYLTSPEDLEALLADAIVSGDPAYIARACEIIERAKTKG